MSLTTRLAVLEAVIKERDQAILLAKEFSDAHFADLNHARARDGELTATFLRADIYNKSEDLHRIEREARDKRIGELEVRLTQVTTYGGVILLFIPLLTLIAAHFLLK